VHRQRAWMGRDTKHVSVLVDGHCQRCTAVQLTAAIAEMSSRAVSGGGEEIGCQWEDDLGLGAGSTAGQQRGDRV
jgi:hypothetical protein